MKMYRVNWSEGEGEAREYKHKTVIAKTLGEVAEKYPQAESIYLEGDVAVLEDGKEKKPSGGVIEESSIY